jgi:hypothetical protein
VAIKSTMGKMSVQEEGPVQKKMDNGTTQPAVRNINLFERLLKLPVPIVLLSMWLAGAALVGLCVLMLYHLFRVLV